MGRQPGIVYGVMRTSDAVNPAPGLVYGFVLATAVHVVLTVAVVYVMQRLAAVPVPLAPQERDVVDTAWRPSWPAAMSSSRCATEEVPGMGSMTGERRSSPASASWAGVALVCVASCPGVRLVWPARRLRSGTTG